jgi:hypothetical protein
VIFCAAAEIIDYLKRRFQIDRDRLSGKYSHIEKDFRELERVVRGYHEPGQNHAMPQRRVVSGLRRGIRAYCRIWTGAHGSVSGF